MAVFAHMFDHILEKNALSKGDIARLLGQSVKHSLTGSHGIKGLGQVVSKPLKHSWEGFRDMNPVFQGLGALGVGSAALGGDGGPAQRAGKTIGNILPFAFMAPSLGPKAPGFLGAMAAQEVLGGGMAVHKGIMERGGEAIDSIFGLGRKRFPTPNAMRQHMPQLGKLK